VLVCLAVAAAFQVMLAHIHVNVFVLEADATFKAKWDLVVETLLQFVLEAVLKPQALAGLVMAHKVAFAVKVVEAVPVTVQQEPAYSAASLMAISAEH